MAALDGVIPAIIGAANAAGGDFQIERSLRFNSSDTAHLSRTFSTFTDINVGTISFWLKRSAEGSSVIAAGWDGGVSYSGSIQFNSSDNALQVSVGGSSAHTFKTNAILRDFSAWYHVVAAWDRSASAADKVKVWINGVAQTSSDTGYQSWTSGDCQIWAANSGNRIGRGDADRYNNLLNGYLAEYHYIDGQALDETDFGEYDANNVWQPKEYSGTYGSNGFYLKFADNSSAVALGTDSSGNNNTWSVNNISVSPGAGNDSLIDTPTNYTAASGNNGGNYCTLNPLKNQSQTLKQSNLECSGTSGRSTGTLYASSGKFYWEFTAGSSYTMSGIESSTSPQAASFPGENDQQYALYGNNGSGQLYHNNSASSFDGFVSGDVIGVALDMDGGNLYFYKNGSAMNSGSAAVTGLTGAWTANCRSGSGAYDGDTVFNFGQRPFAYTPPTGYVSLCTTNLADPTISDGTTAIDVDLYTGTGSTLERSNFSFSPDLVWIKNRSSTYEHLWFDVVRGATNYIKSNSTALEQTNASTLSSFDSDGFTLGGDNEVNKSSETYVAWAWDAGTTTSTNNDGSTQSSVRVSTTNGFSIGTWTGAGARPTDRDWET